MGDVACIIRVMPESPEVDLEALKVTLKETAPEIHEIQEQPIGFGLKALMIVAVVGDKGGQTDRLEESALVRPRSRTGRDRRSDPDLSLSFSRLALPSGAAAHSQSSRSKTRAVSARMRSTEARKAATSSSSSRIAIGVTPCRFTRAGTPMQTPPMSWTSERR